LLLPLHFVVAVACCCCRCIGCCFCIFGCHPSAKREDPLLSLLFFAVIPTADLLLHCLCRCPSCFHSRKESVVAVTSTSGYPKASALGLLYAFLSAPISKTGKSKNKVEKVGMFSAALRPPHKTPRKTHIPPQTHHNFTTTKHKKIAKPPAKTTLPHTKIFFSKNNLALTFFAIKVDRESGTPHGASEVVLPNPAPQT
jgi:hypothetical protein